MVNKCMVYMFIDVCIDTCTDMCIDMCMNMCRDMCGDMCMSMCLDMITDMCIDGLGVLMHSRLLHPRANKKNPFWGSGSRDILAITT